MTYRSDIIQSKSLQVFKIKIDKLILMFTLKCKESRIAKKVREKFGEHFVISILIIKLL